jgi:hypothetical protein
MIKSFSILLSPVLVLMSGAAMAMPYIPTDDIALSTPDPEIIEKLGGKRLLDVRNLVKTYHPDFAKVAKLSNAEMSSLCPAFGALSEGRKISFFAFVLDVYIHGLRLQKRVEMPIPDPKTMSPKQLEALRLEYGDLVPPASLQEFYDAVSRYDEAQIHLKAREMLQLFQRGPVSPAELHALLKPEAINKPYSIDFLKSVLSKLTFCRFNP